MDRINKKKKPMEKYTESFRVKLKKIVRFKKYVEERKKYHKNNPLMTFN